MRSFSFSTLALAATLAATPLAGAFASADDAAPMALPHPATVSHQKVILDQLSSVSDGISADLRDRSITPAEARTLRADARDIRKETMAVAAADHGRIPAGQYDQLLQRVEHLSGKVATFTY